MNWLLLWGLVLAPITAVAGPQGEAKLFKADKIKLLKIETTAGEKNYFVEFPFDPSVGSNTNRIEAEVGAENGCKSFTMISPGDRIEVKVTAMMAKGECTLSEEIKPWTAPKTLHPMGSKDLSDENCPRGWKIVVLNLGNGGFNCESNTCSCQDPARNKCGDVKEHLKEVRLPDDTWKCADAPGGCIWCGPSH